MPPSERAPVQSVARTLALLEAVVEEGEATLGNLAERLDLSRSTVHRLLSALAVAGYVAQSPGGRYRIGMQLETLSRTVLRESRRVTLAAAPQLQEIRDRYDETVNLVELNGLSARYVDQVESSRPVRMFNQVGNEVPLHASAAGKAMLAFQGEAFRRSFLARAPFARMTEATITGGAEMANELELIRGRGYAFDMQERDEGVICVAAPILASSVPPTAAISVSGPADRMSRLDLDEVGRSLVAASEQVSAALTVRSA